MNHTFTIEVADLKAVDLLKKLEELKLIKFLKKDKKSTKKLSEQLKTTISKEQSENLEQYIKTIREEW